MNFMSSILDDISIPSVPHVQHFICKFQFGGGAAVHSGVFHLAVTGGERNDTKSHHARPLRWRTLSGDS
jgi:hypothetical protein